MFKSNRNRNNQATGLAGATVLLFALFFPANGLAYQNREHQRVVDQAYQLLNLMRRGQFLPAKVAAALGVPAPQPLTARPETLDPSEDARWQRFVQEALPAPDILDGLLTELPDPKYQSGYCGNFFPQDNNSPPTNVSQLAQCRASDMAFAPARGWGTNTDRCYLRKGYYLGDADQAEFYQDVPNKLTGALLGYWAQNVDEMTDDTHMSVRPTNILFNSSLNNIVTGASDDGLEVLVVPFTCFWDLLTWSGDCLDDARNVSHSIDPISFPDYLELPLGDMSGNDLAFAHVPNLTSIWHFIRPLAQGTFNKIPGLRISEGCLPTAYGCSWDFWDTLALGGMDLIGLTLEPDASQGVKHYALYADGEVRTYSDWVSTSAAHVEFEPLDNVARYGWDSSKKGHIEANLLGWPLHVIVDSLVPHHAAGVLGWGHKEWEDYADKQWPTTFNEGSIQHYQDFQSILAEAYRYWSFLDDKWSQSQKLALSAYIEMIATETITAPDSTVDGVFVSYYSDSTPDFGHELLFMQTLLKRGIGSVLAFLVKASHDISPKQASTDPCSCSDGYGRLGVDVNGRLIHTNVCTACNSGVFAGLAAWLDGECVPACPQDKPFGQPISNMDVVKCVATCTQGACLGVSCPSADAPFVENGVCVGQCSGANPVVAYNRICQHDCPIGQTSSPVAGNPFCVPAPATHQCYNQSQDAYFDCCRLHGCGCTVAADCDSGLCTADGICLGSTGEHCASPAECASGSCQGFVCAQGIGGKPCAKNTDCRSGECQPPTQDGQAGQCSFVPGQGCENSGQCGTGATCSLCSEDGCVCCRSNDVQCSDDGQCCSQSCVEGTCSPASGLGQGCGTNHDCQSGVCDGVCKSCRHVYCACAENTDCDSAFCNIPESGEDQPPNTIGSCLAVAGERCGFSWDCLSGSCVAGLCAAGTTGALCASNADCISGTCDGPLPSRAGRCVQPTGGACNGSSECSTQSQCTAGHCCLKDASACGVDSECCSQSCWLSGPQADHKCHTLLPAGQPCQWDEQCLNRKCYVGSCSNGAGAYCSEPQVQCAESSRVGLPVTYECRNNRCCATDGSYVSSVTDCCSGAWDGSKCGMIVQ